MVFSMLRAERMPSADQNSFFGQEMFSGISDELAKQGFRFEMGSVGEDRIDELVADTKKPSVLRINHRVAAFKTAAPGYLHQAGGLWICSINILKPTHAQGALEFLPMGIPEKPDNASRRKQRQSAKYCHPALQHQHGEKTAANVEVG